MCIRAGRRPEQSRHGQAFRGPGSFAWWSSDAGVRQHQCGAWRGLAGRRRVLCGHPAVLHAVHTHGGCPCRPSGGTGWCSRQARSGECHPQPGTYLGNGGGAVDRRHAGLPHDDRRSNVPPGVQRHLGGELSGGSFRADGNGRQRFRRPRTGCLPDQGARWRQLCGPASAGRRHPGRRLRRNHRLRPVRSRCRFCPAGQPSEAKPRHCLPAGRLAGRTS
ncbi:hypothetical protein PJL18_04332 [Paenarthrobacter nicotinovorans]|nr:hypothetical protein [Paenarthrobacter nicotinovorans]